MKKLSLNNLTLLGKHLIVIGTFLGIHPFLIFISGPMFLLGLLIVWKTNFLTKKKKIIWTTTPLVTILIIWAIIMMISFKN